MRNHGFVLSQVERTLCEQGLVEPGERILVAVSGGPDSTALLHALSSLSVRLGLLLSAACVDHRLRSASSAEAREVVLCCKALGLRCEVLEVDVEKARHAHVSLQEAARNVRLAALEAAALRLGCAKVAVGHTADDQAETILFRILRGTGLKGLAGIPFQRGIFIRPLLEVRRAEILAYLAKRKIQYLSDPSNQNPRFARSRIRHQVLPLLAQENPQIVEALLSLARAARKPGIPAWREVLPADLYLPGRAALEVDRLVQEGHGTRRVAVQGGELLVHYGKVTWHAKGEGPSRLSREVPRAEGPHPIVGPGTYRLSSPAALAIEVLLWDGEGSPDVRSALFDAAKIVWPLCLRTMVAGDRMMPRLGRGTRKLSDLLIDAKIPRLERATLPILCDGSGAILFVPGLRVAELGRPTQDTRKWIEVRVLR